MGWDLGDRGVDVETWGDVEAGGVAESPLMSEKRLLRAALMAAAFSALVGACRWTAWGEAPPWNPEFCRCSPGRGCGDGLDAESAADGGGGVGSSS